MTPKPTTKVFIAEYSSVQNIDQGRFVIKAPDIMAAWVEFAELLKEQPLYPQFWDIRLRRATADEREAAA
jgi:hypothetical protein